MIIEASTHRVHLLKSNTLTFDSTGSGRPLAAIAANIAQYLNVPYVRVDCSQLVSSKWQRKIKYRYAVYSYRLLQKTCPLFKFPTLAAAWQTDQPMHSQSAKMNIYKLISLNFSGSGGL